MSEAICAMAKVMHNFMTDKMLIYITVAKHTFHVYEMLIVRWTGVCLRMGGRAEDEGCEAWYGLELR